MHNHGQEATEVVVVYEKKDARAVEPPLSLPGGDEITTKHTICRQR